MVGLLDRFFSRPGAGEGLGLLGAYLMAAGAPTTDPGASNRLMAEGLRSFHGHTRQSRLDEENRKVREAQLSEIEERTAERKQKRENANRMVGLLYGPSGVWRDPDTGQVSPPVGLLSKIPEDNRALLTGMMMADPTKAYEATLGAMQPKAPTVQTQYEDKTGRERKVVWNPTTRAWEPFGGVKAESQGVTLPQQANNAEVMAARNRLLVLEGKLRPGQSLRDMVAARTQKASDTGRVNTEFDQFIERDYRIATNRLVGDDPGYNEFLARLDRKVRMPEARAPQPAQPQGPGLLSSILDRMRGMFPDAAGTSTPPGVTSEPGVAPSPSTPTAAPGTSMYLGRNMPQTFSPSGTLNPETGPVANVRAPLGRNTPQASASAPGVSAVPNATQIDFLRRNPHLASQFDEKFGRGAAARYLGMDNF